MSTLFIIGYIVISIIVFVITSICFACAERTNYYLIDLDFEELAMSVIAASLITLVWPVILIFYIFVYILSIPIHIFIYIHNRKFNK